MAPLAVPVALNRVKQLKNTFPKCMGRAQFNEIKRNNEPVHFVLFITVRGQEGTTLGTCFSVHLNVTPMQLALEHTKVQLLQCDTKPCYLLHENYFQTIFLSHLWMQFPENVLYSCPIL
ncbi:hypothetical protein IscW_ISCW018026 [Ixodes scapularis]|uniref:Uncharacterized protein n=1 Tax=Ixodes scapularis TaxID=6945 RepID=B7PF16_IXOSC|nr:hypothetical protein IscW_ISCW018026 [Ixodes scapularis]|eukprot:XP_002433788.1 hypothetical protein IscW_ISCW018026 [Ixodes scapularis]